MNKFWMRLEIIGYSRAIGAMINQQGVTAEMVKGLYEAREEAINKLAAMKAEAREARFGKTMANA